MTAEKALPQDLIANLLADYKKLEDLIGENGLLKQIAKALIERALEAEMEAHIGHGKNEPVANASGNIRNVKQPFTPSAFIPPVPLWANTSVFLLA